MNRRNDPDQPTTPEGGAAHGDPPSAPKRWVRRLDTLQRAHGWLGQPYGVAKKFSEDQAGQLAALVAYYGFFSLFPLMLVLLTVLGFVLAGNEDLQADIVDSALAQFPIIGDQIRENVGSIDGSGLALAIGIVGALWAGLGALQAAQSAMNSVWDVPIRERPGFVESRLRGLIMLGVLGTGVLATTVVGTAAGVSEALGPFAAVLGFVLSALLAIGLLALAYRVLTDRDLSWSQVLPGAVVAGVAWAVLQLVGGWYVGTQLKGASQSYGFFGVVLGLLSWIYLQAQVVLVGAEVNVVRDRQLWPRSLSGEDLTDADHRALRAHAKVEERRQEELVEVDLAGRPGEPDLDGADPDASSGRPG